MSEAAAAAEPIADFWPDEEIPKGWTRPAAGDGSTIYLDLGASDRGHHFRSQTPLTRAEFLASGSTRKERYEALLAKQRLAQIQLDATMERIRSQRAHTYDHRMAQTALVMVAEFADVDRSSREILFHRLALAFAQARGEMNLDILKAPPIQEIDPDEQVRAAHAGQTGEEGRRSLEEQADDDPDEADGEARR